ncbi:MAG: hypothetical protein WAL95_01290, partial [Candidatus Acidiferrales bacterium]
MRKASTRGGGKQGGLGDRADGEKIYRRDAEGAEKNQDESATGLASWQAGAQQAAPLPIISDRSV